MENFVIQNTDGEFQAIVKTDLEKLKKVNEMHEALEEAIIGLEWWRDSFPEGIGREDEEKLIKFKKALGKEI